MKKSLKGLLDFRISMEEKEARQIAQEISDMFLGKYSIHGVSKTPKELSTSFGGLEGYCIEVYGLADNLSADVPNPYKGVFIVYKKEPQALAF